MSGLVTSPQAPLGPVYVNVYNILRSQLAALKAQYGLSDLSVVFQGGQYYLEINGRLIEITFLDGDFITAEMMAELQQMLGQLLEQNGYQEITAIETLEATNEFDATGFAGFIAFTGFGAALINVFENEGSGSSQPQSSVPSANPQIEEIRRNPTANTLTLDYDLPLDENKLPTPNDFEIFIGDQTATITDVSINNDKVVLYLSDGFGQDDRITVSYLDQKGDTQQAIQGIDGKLAAEFVNISVIDGYISGAQLYIDTNENGVPDPGELLQGVTTDARGMFLLDTSLNPTNAALLIVGGTNIDTGLDNNTILSAPEGSTVITPTTTLIQTMVREGMVSGADKAAKIQAAETAVKIALGIDPTVDLTKFDPIAAFNSPTQGDTAKTLHKFNTSVISIVESFGTGTEAKAESAKNELAAQITTSANQSTPLALDAALINKIVDAVLPAGDNNNLKTNLSGVVEAIQDAENLEDITATQISHNGLLENLKAADQNLLIIKSKEFGDFIRGYQTAIQEIEGFMTNYLDALSILSDPNLSSLNLQKISNDPNNLILKSSNNILLTYQGTNVEILTTDPASFNISQLEKFEIDNNGSIASASLNNGILELRQGANLLEIDTNQLFSNVSDLENPQVLEALNELGDSSLSYLQNGSEVVSLESSQQYFAAKFGANTFQIEGDWTNWPVEQRTAFFEALIEADPDNFSPDPSLINGLVINDVKFNNVSVLANILAKEAIQDTPEVLIAVAIEGDNIVNAAEDDTVSVTGTSTGVEQGQTVNVTLSDGSTDVDVTATVGADGTWTAADADISALTNGTITITADVSDAAGNAATQAIKTITLDNAAPVMSIDPVFRVVHPASGESVEFSYSEILNANEPISLSDRNANFQDEIYINQSGFISINGQLDVGEIDNEPDSFPQNIGDVLEYVDPQRLYVIETQSGNLISDLWPNITGEFLYIGPNSPPETGGVLRPFEIPQKEFLVLPTFNDLKIQDYLNDGLLDESDWGAMSEALENDIQFQKSFFSLLNNEISFLGWANTDDLKADPIWQHSLPELVEVMEHLQYRNERLLSRATSDVRFDESYYTLRQVGQDADDPAISFSVRDIPFSFVGQIDIGNDVIGSVYLTSDGNLISSSETLILETRKSFPDNNEPTIINSREISEFSTYPLYDLNKKINIDTSEYYSYLSDLKVQIGDRSNYFEDLPVPGKDHVLLPDLVTGFAEYETILDNQQALDQSYLHQSSITALSKLLGKIQINFIDKYYSKNIPAELYLNSNGELLEDAMLKPSIYFSKLMQPNIQSLVPWNPMDRGDSYLHEAVFETIKPNEGKEYKYGGLDDLAGEVGSGTDTLEISFEVRENFLDNYGIFDVDGAVEIYIEGNDLPIYEVSLKDLRQNQDTSSHETGELKLIDPDGDNRVELEIKVKNSSGAYIQDNGDVTWEYQW